jgi:hypothetical protein
MTRTQGNVLIAALAFVSSLCVPTCARAQSDFYGSWYGAVNYTITVETTGGQVIGGSQGSGLGTLGIEFTTIPPFSGQIASAGFGTSNMDFGVDGLLSLSSYSSLGASGTVAENDYPAGAASVTFNVEGYLASATYSSAFIDLDDNIETITFASFYTVPEPSSFVQAALGIITLSIFVGVRRLCTR